MRAEIARLTAERDEARATSDLHAGYFDGRCAYQAGGSRELSDVGIAPRRRAGFCMGYDEEAWKDTMRRALAALAPDHPLVVAVDSRGEPTPGPATIICIPASEHHGALARVVRAEWHAAERLRATSAREQSLRDELEELKQRHYRVFEEQTVTCNGHRRAAERERDQACAEVERMRATAETRARAIKAIHTRWYTGDPDTRSTHGAMREIEAHAVDIIEACKGAITPKETTR